MDHVGDALSPILLTGASGYLGRRVLARLIARGVPCVPSSLSGAVGVACDLTDTAAVRRLLARVAPSAVIHCASIVPRSPACYGDVAGAESSVAMLRTLTDQATCPIVFASSMTVYGRVSGGPVEENDAGQPEPGYARGKWLAERTLLQRRVENDVAMRLPGLFGLPRRTGVLYNAARALLVYGRFELTRPPEPWSAMAVDDAAEYLVRAAVIDSTAPAQVVNVGYEGEFSVPAAVALIADHCDVAWSDEGTDTVTFSMHLQRLERRFGLVDADFRLRLREFVDAVRRDVASPCRVGP